MRNIWYFAVKFSLIMNAIIAVIQEEWQIAIVLVLFAIFTQLCDLGGKNNEKE